MSEAVKENKVNPTENKDNKDQIVLSNQADWSSKLLSDKLKSNEIVNKFDSVEDLANELVRVSGVLKNKTDFEPLKENAEHTEFVRVSKGMFNVKEGSYTKDFSHSEKALKYGLPSKLIEPFLKELEEDKVKKKADESKEKLDKYREEIKKRIPEKSFDVRFDGGLNALGWTRDKFKEMIPDEVQRHQPDFIEGITKLGEKQYTAKQKTILDDKDKTLPQDPHILRERMLSLNRQVLDARFNGLPYADLQEKEEAVTLKYKKVTGQLENENRSLGI